MQTLVSSFMSVAGVVRIVFLEFCAIFCLSGLLANIAQDLAGQGSPFAFGALIYYCVFLVIGLACGAGIVQEILRPVAGATSFRGTLRLGGIQGINPVDGNNPYFFWSTHPSFIFVDAAMLFTVLVIFAVRLHGWHAFNGMRVFDWVSSVSGIMLAGAVPLLRLFSWYGLERKLPAELARGAVAGPRGPAGPVGLLTVLRIDAGAGWWYDRAGRGNGTPCNFIADGTLQQVKGE